MGRLMKIMCDMGVFFGGGERGSRRFVFGLMIDVLCF